MDCSAEPAGIEGIRLAVIAGLVGAFQNSKSFSDKRKHLRHEGHSFELPINVESPKNFFLTPNFDPLPDFQRFLGCHGVVGSVFSIAALKLLTLGAHSHPPAQISIERTFADELLYMGNAHIARPFEFFEPQANPLNRFIQLHGPFLRGPLRFETRQYSRDLAEIDAIAALVRAAIPCVFDFAVRNSLVNDVRQIADLIVFLGAAHIERFAMNQILRSIQYGNEGARDVFDVDNWPPGRAVALDVNVTCGGGPGDKVVEHQIESQSRGYPIGGGVAEKGRAETGICQLGNILLDENLGTAVGRYG